MLLHDTPGLWIPLTEQEWERAKQLLDEIAELAQTAPQSDRHNERLAEFDMLIGFAAASAAIAETEGPEAEKRWRAKQYSPWKEQMRLISEAMGGAWRRLRRGEDPDPETANVIALKERRN